MNFEVKFSCMHYYIEQVIMARIEVSNTNWDFPVCLWEKNPLNLGMKYQRVMKRMQEVMRRVLPSLVHRGYPEMNLSMIILSLFFFSFSVNQVAHCFSIASCIDTVWARFAFRTKQPEETKRKRKKQQKEKAIDDDVVEDLVLSSDEEMPSSHSPSAGKNDDADHLPSKRKPKQKKHRTKRLKKN